MTKKELAMRMSSHRSNCSLSQSNALFAIEVFMEEVSSALSQGESVYLRGFGTFQVVRRQEKKGRDITRNAEVIIPAHNVVKFVPSNSLKRNMNKPKTRRSGVCPRS